METKPAFLNGTYVITRDVAETKIFTENEKLMMKAVIDAVQLVEL